MFEIEIRNLETRARIGITTRERKKYQKLLVTLRLNYQINKKNHLDDIKYLKNYSSIIKFTKLFIEKSRCKSLEKLVFDCSIAVKNKFKIKKVFLSINKIGVAKRYNCESISVSK